ncbi:Mitochondrial outer membrane protein porin 2 [Forsythia ovata]|uniref:Mitochondrial outer membrane protein porin 2 n=1 Tax=Forsythia ovata TaxID=205694 RepID=A0ABD1UWX8_9LAMI
MSVAGLNKEVEDRRILEILIKDYSDDQKFVVFSQSNSGLVLGSTLVKNGGLSSGDVAAQYKFKNAILDVKFDTESNIEVQYFHEHASLTTAVSLNKSPALDISATIGTPSIAFGTQAS